MPQRDKINWFELQRQFLEITRKAGGPSKSSSGSIKIWYNIHGIQVLLGTYDISDWPRFTFIGEESRIDYQFQSELEAYQATFDKVQEANKIVEYELEKTPTQVNH